MAKSSKKKKRPDRTRIQTYVATPLAKRIERAAKRAKRSVSSLLKLQLAEIDWEQIQ